MSASNQIMHDPGENCHTYNTARFLERGLEKCQRGVTCQMRSIRTEVNTHTCYLS